MIHKTSRRGINRQMHSFVSQPATWRLLHLVTPLFVDRELLLPSLSSARGLPGISMFHAATRHGCAGDIHNPHPLSLAYVLLNSHREQCGEIRRSSAVRIHAESDCMNTIHSVHTFLFVIESAAWNGVTNGLRMAQPHKKTLPSVPCKFCGATTCSAAACRGNPDPACGGLWDRAARHGTAARPDESERRGIVDR